jgi:hypothetical protein
VYIYRTRPRTCEGEGRSQVWRYSYGEDGRCRTQDPCHRTRIGECTSSVRTRSLNPLLCNEKVPSVLPSALPMSGYIS